MSTLVTAWPRLGTTVTLEDGVTVIDQDGRVLEYTQEVRDLLRLGTLLDYDPRLEPTTSPDVGPSGHALEHVLAGAQEIDGDRLAIDIVPAGYTPAVDALAANVRHLGAHLKGIGAALSPAMLYITEPSASHVFVLSDAYCTIDCTLGTAIGLVLPLHATVPYDVGVVLRFLPSGLGQITVTGAPGVTVTGPGGKTKSGQQNAAIYAEQKAIDSWLLSGALAS